MRNESVIVRFTQIIFGLIILESVCPIGLRGSVGG
jgi:hypothetical protein